MSLALAIPIGGIAAGLVSFWAYQNYTNGVCHSRRDLRGRTVIVTGANSGIGLETARDLAARNARVILACRTMTTGEKAKEDIAKTTGNSNLVLKHLDLSSFQSVRTFAKDILENEPRLDILINNGGVSLPTLQRNEEGLEMTMATNHFGHFLLTDLLSPLLKKSAPSRVVVVSSVVHEWAKLDFDNINAQKFFKSFYFYKLSKLANVLFTRELSNRLEGTGVTVNALHPGVVRTELTRNNPPLMKATVNAFTQTFFKNAEQGAQTTIHVAVAEELEGVSGKYFSDCREKALRPHALDAKAAKELWDYSVDVTKLK